MQRKASAGPARSMAIISTEDWSLFVVDVKPLATNNRLFAVGKNNADFHTFHVVDPNSWLVWRVFGAPYVKEEEGLVLEIEEGAGWSPIEAACLHGMILTPDHLRAVCKIVGCPMEEKCGNISEEMKALIGHVFAGKDDLQEHCLKELKFREKTKKKTTSMTLS